MMKIAHVMSVSGGKDSTAMYLRAMELGIEFIPVFADTGNEHPITLDYVKNLHIVTGGPKVTWVKADFAENFPRKRAFIEKHWVKQGVPKEQIAKVLTDLRPSGVPFLDMCRVKGGFPSTCSRFCSAELKIEPIFQQIQEPLMEAGHLVISWQGVRADESRKRAKMPEMDWVGPRLMNYRPILRWTVEDVFAIHRKFKVEPNPLYKLGFKRVGCMPCIHATKEDLRTIADRFPDVIDRVDYWEKKVSSCSKTLGIGSFFSSNRIPGADKTKPSANIHECIRHARTARGGKQFDIFKQEGLEQPTCSSEFGLCE